MVLYCKYSGSEGTWIECWIVEKRYLWELEVNAVVCQPQSRIACYVKLLCWYIYIYICMLGNNWNLWQYDVCCIRLYTCTSIHVRYCHWNPELWYDAEVLGQIWNELIDCNAKMLGCQRLSGMTNEVNMGGSPSEAMPWYWVTRTNMLSGLVS